MVDDSLVVGGHAEVEVFYFVLVNKNMCGWSLLSFLGIINIVVLSLLQNIPFWTIGVVVGLINIVIAGLVILYIMRRRVKR